MVVLEFIVFSYRHDKPEAPALACILFETFKNRTIVRSVGHRFPGVVVWPQVRNPRMGPQESNRPNWKEEESKSPIWNSLVNSFYLDSVKMLRDALFANRRAEATILDKTVETVETFSNEFFGQYREPRTSGNHSLWFEFQLQNTVLAVSDLRQRFIARDQPDLPFDLISHVVTSVCYLLGTILKIKYKFWENLSCLI